MLKPHIKTSAGVSLVELLIVLAIMALLLTSLAAAFNASVINYRQNEDIFKTVNSARQALCRMTTQIRTGLVDPNDVADQSTCQVLCSDGSEILYWYSEDDDILYLRDLSSGSDYVLCDNVVALTFKKDNSSPSGDVKSVQISMTVEKDDIQKIVSAAAVVRKIIY